jgi:aspartate dehydrogenase
MQHAQPLKVAIAGLGAIGLPVARALDAGQLPGLMLAAVAVRDSVKAGRVLADFMTAPKIVPIEHLGALADVVVECAPKTTFRAIAESALKQGRILVPLSVGQLLDHMDLVELAAKHGGRILVPTGALLGLDAVRAVSEGTVSSIKIVTRKPPAGLKGAPWLIINNISVDGLTAPLRVFAGSAREAIKGFPANVNVAVALSLAGIGPDKTQVEVWADPNSQRNTHTIEVLSDSSDFTMTISGRPTESNPATGRITPLSALATLRRLTAPLVVGT